MAWRIDEVVEHGMIDNTVEGTTTGKIWLIGRDEPLILSLNGDCWQDLAGTILEFENPEPFDDPEPVTLDTDQTGVIGDMTASRKARVPTIGDVEIEECMREGREVPCQWQNILYLEWFSESNGRVLLEAVDFTLKISDREWQMDSDAEEAQKLANLSAMRDFLNQVIRRIEPQERKNSDKQGAKGEMNEFEWEERLKESDRLTDAYQEVLEKYMEDSDSERKEAFVMGWDGLLGSMADRDEGLDDDFDDFDDEDEDDEDDDDDGASDWRSADDDGEEGGEGGDLEDDWENESHPLQTRARDLALRAMELVGKGDGREKEAEGAAMALIANLTQVSGKLAGVLYGSGEGYQPEAGFIIAVLKRCLGWINDALGACSALFEDEKDKDQRSALLHLREDIFALRDGIIELSRSLKQR